MFCVNKILIFVFLCFGIDYISDKYNFPWQVIIIVIAVIFSVEQTQKNKKQKSENQELQDKLWNCLKDSQFNCITIEQKYKIVNTISKKEYKGIFH